MLPELTAEEFASALDLVAADVLATLDDDAPPIDALALARALRLAIAWDDRQLGRGRIVRLGSTGGAKQHGSILLRPEPRPERVQWAVAHEIGETCAFAVFDRLGVDPREAPPAARENVANHLAGRLLLPRDAFGTDGRETDWDLLALKSRYSTASHELIARRMLDFSPPITITIFDHGRRTLRRGNRARRTPPLVPNELSAWRTTHDESRPVIVEDSGCRVQAWPIHEPDWRGEILRTAWNMGLGEECD